MPTQDEDVVAVKAALLKEFSVTDEMEAKRFVVAYRTMEALRPVGEQGARVMALLEVPVSVDIAAPLYKALKDGFDSLPPPGGSRL